MALLRNRSTEQMTRSSRPASNRLTRPTRNRPAVSINQQYKTSSNEVHDEPDSEPDFNEAYIQSIEELLPEKEHVSHELANIAGRQSLERQSNTPGRPIKVERISNTLSDVYDASPHGHVHKAAHVERRQTSRSTAQLTTPASSPDCKCSGPRLTEECSMVKSEVGYGSNGRHSDIDGSCTPPVESDPRRTYLLKGLMRRGNHTTPQISPSRHLHSYRDTEDARDSRGNMEDRSTAKILPRGLITETNNDGKDAIISSRNLHTFSSKCLAKRQSQSKRSRAGQQQILPPATDCPSSSKIATSSVSVRTLSTPPSTPAESLQENGSLSGNRTCCKLMCLECTPKDLQKEYGLGPPEKRPDVSRFKIPSVCPSSVSSFDIDDDIPTSNRQLQEVRRAVIENTKAFASDRLSEISPSLKYSNSFIRLTNHFPSSSTIEGTSSRYDDLDAPNLKRKNPCRSIFRAASNVVSNDEGLLRAVSQHSNSLESNISVEGEKSQQGARRLLRSCSITNKISRNSQSFKTQAGDRDGENSSHGGECKDCTEYEPGDDASSIEENGRGQPLELNHSGLTLKKLYSYALVGVRNSDQGTKRGREGFEEEQPTWFHDEDVGGEDDLVEIHADEFRASESMRKKRHKTQLQNAKNNADHRSPAPKEESSIEDGEFFVEPEDLGTSEADTIETTAQETPLCDYYMNTYWEHGRAGDGRRARDGFTSYFNFKEYCKKNKQPIDDRCVLTYKKDLKHYLLCEHHASLRQDLFRVAWNFEHNPGFSFKSSNKDEETRRLQNEAIGNAPSPGSASRGVVAPAAAAAEAEMVTMIGEILKGIGTSHAADVAQLAKSKKKLENEVKGLKRRLARIRKR